MSAVSDCPMHHMKRDMCFKGHYLVCLAESLLSEPRSSTGRPGLRAGHCSGNAVCVLGRFVRWKHTAGFQLSQALGQDKHWSQSAMQR